MGAAAGMHCVNSAFLEVCMSYSAVLVVCCVYSMQQYCVLVLCTDLTLHSSSPISLVVAASKDVTANVVLQPPSHHAVTVHC
jgi:hypothetical protein